MTTTALFRVLANDPESVMSARTVHALVNRQDSTPVALETIRRRLRELGEYGWATWLERYNWDTHRNERLWSITDDGIRARLGRGGR